MQHGERERSLQVEVARLRAENERLEGTLASAFGDLRESEKRAEKAEAECEVNSQLHAATALDLVESQEALAAARRECAAAKEAHEYCLEMFSREWLTQTKNRSIFAAHIFAILDAALAAPAAAAGEEK